jgi:hypothetical protein
MVYWNSVDVTLAIIGGVIIALGVTMNLLFYGKVTNITEMIDGVLMHEGKQFRWMIAFLTGMVTLPNITKFIFGTELSYKFATLKFFDSNMTVATGLTIPGWIIGGLLVGYGARLCGGDTLTHGLCGITRLNKRHLAAVACLVGSGVLIATLRYHFPFFDKGSPIHVDIKTFLGALNFEFNGFWGWLTLGLYVTMVIFVGAIMFLNREYLRQYLLSFITGLVFGFGLMISGMCRVSKVIGLLTADGDRWDPTLLFMIITALGICLITFSLILRKNAPLVSNEF